jgi:hypothetical protein
MESGRKAGNCAKCQRELGRAISRARHLALLPYAPEHLRVTGSISPASSAGGARAEEDEEARAVLAEEDESEDLDDDVEPSDDDDDSDDEDGR